MARLVVCQNESCSQQCSGALLRDIEECCGNSALVEPTSCLNHCGQGPNVQVTGENGKSRVVTGIQSFKKMERIVADATGQQLEGVHKKVAQLKFIARREEVVEQRLAKLKEAFDLLGGDKKAAKREPEIASHLLVMRSQALLEQNAEAALADAQAAVKLAPKWPQSQLAAATTLGAVGRFDDAVAAVTAALDLVQSAFEKRIIKKELQKMKERASSKKHSQDRISNKTTDDKIADDRISKSQLNMWGEEGVRALVKPGESAEGTLYDRLGGKEPLQKLVYGVYDAMRVDPDLGPHFERFAKTPGTLERLKIRTVDYLGGEWGGPPYMGPNLFESHASMEIGNGLYDGMVSIYRKILTTMNVSESISREICKSVEGMRAPIVDPDGIFVKEMEKRLAKATEERKERMRLHKLKQEEAKKAKKQTEEAKKSKPKPQKTKTKDLADNAASEVQFAFKPSDDAPPQQPPGSQTLHHLLFAVPISTATRVC